MEMAVMEISRFVMSVSAQTRREALESYILIK